MAKDEQQDKREFDSEAEIARVREGVMAAPEPGTDPDSQQRAAKTLAAMPGVDVPDGLSVDPITDEDREASVNAADKRREALTKDAQADDKSESKSDDKGDDAAARARRTAPQGRTSTPTTKA